MKVVKKRNYKLYRKRQQILSSLPTGATADSVENSVHNTPLRADMHTCAGIGMLIFSDFFLNGRSPHVERVARQGKRGDAQRDIPFASAEDLLRTRHDGGAGGEDVVDNEYMAAAQKLGSAHGECTGDILPTVVAVFERLARGIADTAQGTVAADRAHGAGHPLGNEFGLVVSP